MSTVFVIGAAGKVGRALSHQLATRGHRVTALHRDPRQADTLREPGVIPVHGDLVQLDPSALATLMDGSEVVVFTAGAGGKGGEATTRAVDGQGLRTAVEAARQAKVPRLLLVSAFPEAGRGAHVSDTFETYMAVKKAADVHLASSELDWVILRPGTLTDDPGQGRVTAGPAITYGSIGREDVAATLVALVERPTIQRVVIELTQGQTPISEALAAYESVDDRP